MPNLITDVQTLIIPLHLHLVLSSFVYDYRRGMDWWMDLLTTYTYHLEQQVITVLSLIATLYKSLQYLLSLFPACYLFIRRALAAACNSGDSSVSRAQVLSSQPPMPNSTPKWTNWVPGWRPFHTNLLVFSSQADFQLTGQSRSQSHIATDGRSVSQSVSQ
jgi:hypothetical protein